MPAGLLLQTLARVEQHDRGIRAGRAGDHVLKKFLVPRRVDDDVVPRRGAKLNLRRVDRDVLLLLLQQRVEQEGVFEVHALRRASLLDLLDLAVRQRVRVEQQPPDQRRLAMIDMADNDDLELLGVFVGGGKGSGGVHFQSSQLPLKFGFQR